MKLPKKGAIAGCAVIGATSFLAATQIAPAHKAPQPVRTTSAEVVCKESGIHATTTADGKGYVMTSAIVCSNGTLTMKGKVKGK